MRVNTQHLRTILININMSSLHHEVTPTFNKAIYHSLLELGADLTPSTRPAGDHEFVLVQVSPSKPTVFVANFLTLDAALQHLSDKLEIYDHEEVRWETGPPELLRSFKPLIQYYAEVVAVWQINEHYELLMVSLSMERYKANAGPDDPWTRDNRYD